MSLFPTERNAASMAATLARVTDPAVYADPQSGNHFASYPAYLAFRIANPWFTALYPVPSFPADAS